MEDTTLLHGFNNGIDTSDGIGGQKVYNEYVTKSFLRDTEGKKVKPISSGILIISGEEDTFLETFIQQNKKLYDIIYKRIEQEVAKELKARYER